MTRSGDGGREPARNSCFNRIPYREDDTRMQKIKWAVAVCAVLAAGASRAEAQMLPWEDKGYLTFNLGMQLQSREFVEASTPVIYAENALITVPHSVSGGLLVDFGGGWRIWRNLAIGAGFSRFADSETPTLTAEIPHPLSFGSLRPATASTGKLSHSETAIHLNALWMFPISDKFEIGAFIGPSFYKISQDFVGGLSTVEGGLPFGTVTISSIDLVSESKRATGVNVGVDGTYLINKNFGAGAFLRFAGASADLVTAGGGTVTVDAGGIQIGGGLRYRF
jgi:hypothetical protein